MSANNWRTCPECIRNWYDKKEQALRKITESYGKVSVEDYNYSKKEYEKMVRSGVSSTLREYYELGMDDTGLFGMSYHCSCDTCGFEFTYKHEEQADLTKKSSPSIH